MTDSKQKFLEEARPLAETLLSYATTEGKQHGITDAKIIISIAQSLANDVEKGDVTQVKSGTTCGVTMLLFAGKRRLSFSMNTLDFDALADGMKQNMEVIHLVPENSFAGLLAKDKVYQGPETDFDTVDPNPPNQEDLIAYAMKMEAAALAQPNVKVVKAVTSKSSHHTLMIATNGLSQEDSNTSAMAYTAVTVEADGKRQEETDWSSCVHFTDMLSAESIGQIAAKKAFGKLGATLPKTGETTIVLDQSTAGEFFGNLVAALDASKVYRDATFLKDKIGQQVVSSSITIVDDPAIARSFASGTADSAGVEMKKVTFIENGVLMCYAASLVESRQLGIEPTGRESGLTNTFVLPGKQTPAELMADIKDGLYIESFDGGSISIHDGSFSVPASGKLIVNGKVTDTAVDGFVISGNLKDMFNGVTVANDTPKLPDARLSFAAPTTRIKKVMIAGGE